MLCFINFTYQWGLHPPTKNVFKSFALNVYVFEFQLLCFTKHKKSQISFKNSRFQIFWRKAQVRRLEISLTLTQKQSWRASLHNFVPFFFLCSATVASTILLSKGSWKQTVSISLLLHQKPFSVFLQKFLTQRQNTTEGIVNPLTSPSLSLTYLISFSLWKTWYGQCYQLSGFWPMTHDSHPK